MLKTKKIISWRDWKGPVLDDNCDDEIAHASVADYVGYMRDHQMPLPDFVTPAARVQLSFDAEEILFTHSEDWGPEACDGVDSGGLQKLLDDWAEKQEINWYEGVQGRISLAGLQEGLTHDDA